MAGKLIITRGLPGSGKSTWAEEIRRLTPDRTRVVTLDDIRAAICARFEAGDEPIAQSIRDFTIRRYLEKDYNVISADTNLSPRTLEWLQKIAEKAGAPCEVKDFTDVPLEECLRRNDYRWMTGDCKVPNSAIVEMHEKFLKNPSSA